MLQETIDRVNPIIPLDRIRVVAGESMSQMIVASCADLAEGHILTEPCGRNTCLAIGLGAQHLILDDSDAVMVVLSSDHLIRPAERMNQILEDASAIAAESAHLITIGVVATRPETGYGYIKLGDEFQSNRGCAAYEVAAFAEKPKAVVAQEYYYSRRYLWNSGIFVWRADSVLEQIRLHQPDMSTLLQEYAKQIGKPGEQKARAKLYDEAASISIDYAILEKASNVLTIKADIIWDDVGSWGALERYKEVDSENNVLIGDTLAFDTYETTVYNDSDGLIATLGVADLVVVRSKDITLVAHKTKLGKIKEMLAELAKDEKTKTYL